MRTPLILSMLIAAGLGWFLPATGLAQCGSEVVSSLEASVPVADEAFGQTIVRSGSGYIVGSPGAGPGRVHLPTGAVLTGDVDGDRFGAALESLFFGPGQGAVIGAPGANENRGSAYVYREGFPLVELDPGPLDPGDEFGTATLARLNSTHVLIGAPGDDDGGVDAGAIYFFERTDNNWTLVHKHVPTTVIAGARIGSSFGFVGTINIMATSGPGTDRVHVFSYPFAPPMMDEGVLDPPLGIDASGFGATVAIGGSGLLVGAPDALGGDGRVFRFEGISSAQVSSTLSYSAVEVIDGMQPNGRFGTALYTHSTSFIVCSPGASTIHFFSKYVTPPGHPFASLFLESDTLMGVPGEEFGAQIALSFDDDAYVIGAPLRGVGGGVDFVEAPQYFCRTIIRGDANGDGAIDIADPIFHLGLLFPSGATLPPCEQTLEVNGDGLTNIADSISLLGFLFNGDSYPGVGVCAPASDISTGFCDEGTVCP